MVTKRVLILGTLTLVMLLSPRGASQNIQADHVGVYGTTMYQSNGPSGQYTMEFDGDEIFYVDLQKKETVWRLPEFSSFASFDPQGGLRNIAVMKNNLNILIERSNRTRAINESPEVSVFSESPVELGQPNVLICFVDNIFPPVVNVTWLRNGQLVTQGVSETDFYPQPDHRFRKFLYLTFLPNTEDVYDCKVEHWGLKKPVLKHWEPQVPSPLPETTETVVCALGLAIGLVGIVVGTILIIRNMRSSSNSFLNGEENKEEPRSFSLTLDWKNILPSAVCPSISSTRSSLHITAWTADGATSVIS